MTVAVRQESAEPRFDPAAHPVLFFDGVCGLCNSSVDSLLRRDRAGVLLFAPLQGETAARVLTEEDVRGLKSLVLVDAEGTHRRSDAVIRVLRLLGGRHGAYAALLRAVPRPLRDLGYRIVSRLRYRLFGKKETCRLPTPEERRRFLP